MGSTDNDDDDASRNVSLSEGTARSLDAASAASIDLVALNNTIVQMRKSIKLAKTWVIKKMLKQVYQLQAKKGTDQQKEKHQRKCQRIKDEIQIIKNLKNDTIAKFALGNQKSFAEVCQMADTTPELRVLTRICELPRIRQQVIVFRETHDDWKSLTAFLMVKQTGRRFKKKNKQKRRDKEKLQAVGCNVQANRKITSMYLQEKLGPDVVIRSRRAELESETGKPLESEDNGDELLLSQLTSKANLLSKQETGSSDDNGEERLESEGEDHLESESAELDEQLQPRDSDFDDNLDDSVGSESADDTHSIFVSSLSSGNDLDLIKRKNIKMKSKRSALSNKDAVVSESDSFNSEKAISDSEDEMFRTSLQMPFETCDRSQKSLVNKKKMSKHSKVRDSANQHDSDSNGSFFERGDCDDDDGESHIKSVASSNDTNLKLDAVYKKKKSLSDSLKKMFNTSQNSEKSAKQTKPVSKQSPGIVKENSLPPIRPNCAAVILPLGQITQLKSLKKDHQIRSEDGEVKTTKSSSFFEISEDEAGSDNDDSLKGPVAGLDYRNGGVKGHLMHPLDMFLNTLSKDKRKGGIGRKHNWERARVEGQEDISQKWSGSKISRGTKGKWRQTQSSHNDNYSTKRNRPADQHYDLHDKGKSKESVPSKRLKTCSSLAESGVHPSWEAKKKQKSQLAIQPFQGKRKTFDD